MTVLMSVRDGARYLSEAIQSILDQSFDDFEFLIVDDASRDASREIVRRYADPRIRLIANERHLGLTRSLNRGIELSRGRYVARMDADDVSMRERLERQVAFLEAHPDCDVVATYAKKIDGNSAEVGQARTPLGADEVRRMLLRGNCITHGSVMMRRDALDRVGAYDETMERAQDYDLWLRISQDHRICTLPEFLYAWRDHEGGIGRLSLEEQDRFAARARSRARSRRIAGLLAAVDDGSLRARGALARYCEMVREEEEIRWPLERFGGIVDRLCRRLPRLRALRYRLSRRKLAREARAVLRDHLSRKVTNADAGRSLVGLIEEIADSEPR